jgi:hypothetical protein
MATFFQVRCVNQNVVGVVDVFTIGRSLVEQATVDSKEPTNGFVYSEINSKLCCVIFSKNTCHPRCFARDVVVLFPSHTRVCTFIATSAGSAPPAMGRGVVVFCFFDFAHPIHLSHRSELTEQSDSSCTAVLDYVMKRLRRKEPRVKYKALLVLKNCIERGHVMFRRELVLRAEEVRAQLGCR